MAWYESVVPERRQPPKGWRTMWVDVPAPGAPPLARLTFLRDFLARWLGVMVVAALLLLAGGSGWATILGVAVVVLSAINLAIVQLRLSRERARQAGSGGT